MREEHQIGTELRQELEARGCALSAAEARALSASLIDLIACGLLVADPDDAAEAVHGLRARSSAGSVVGLGGPETGAPYNIPSLSAFSGDSE